MSNSQKFDTTLKEFDKEVGKLKAVSEVYQTLQSLGTQYVEIRAEFKNSSESLGIISEQLTKEQKKLFSSVENISTLIEEKMEQISNENKDFYKEFESTVKIKLDDNKSEIKHLIEGERDQIRQIFELELSKNFRELSQTIEKGSEKQTQILLEHQNNIIIVIVVLGIISLILGGLTVYQLWM